MYLNIYYWQFDQEFVIHIQVSYFEF